MIWAFLRPLVLPGGCYVNAFGQPFGDGVYNKNLGHNGQGNGDGNGFGYDGENEGSGDGDGNGSGYGHGRGYDNGGDL